jgi:hypothetical protein
MRTTRYCNNLHQERYCNILHQERYCNNLHQVVTYLMKVITVTYLMKVITVTYLMKVKMFFNYIFKGCLFNFKLNVQLVWLKELFYYSRHKSSICRCFCDKTKETRSVNRSIGSYRRQIPVCSDSQTFLHC